VSEDDIIYWQDVLENVQAGRTAGLKCPFCYHGSIQVSKRERVTTVQCENASCRHYIEGRFSDDDVAKD
jgi:hypothetical protein